MATASAMSLSTLADLLRLVWKAELRLLSELGNEMLTHTAMMLGHGTGNTDSSVLLTHLHTGLQTGSYKWKHTNYHFGLRVKKYIYFDKKRIYFPWC